MNSTVGQETGWSRDDIARNIALDIEDGAVVNLGIGMPELVASHIPDGKEVLFHTENGLLGMGLPPPAGEEDPELINAGKRPVTAIPGAAFFHHADSFAMIRGGHIDVCVLGAMEVSEAGDLANWSLGADDAAPAVGGAMDLVAGARQILIATRHCTRDGTPKLVKKCSYPVTGLKVVDRIYTDLAVLDVCPEGLRVVRRAPGIDMAELRRVTGATLVG